MYAPVQPHGPVEPVLEDLFVVRGSFPMAPLVRIPRTMTILRRDGGLTIFNAIRLDPETEAALLALGPIRNLVRLAHLHGCDDAYYLERHHPTYWALPGERLPGATPDVEITETHSPVRGGRFTVLRHTRLPEAALHLEGDGGLLVSCDAIQNLVDTAHASLLGKAVAHGLGFVRPCGVVPMWKLRAGGSCLRPDFDSLLSLRFEHLVTAHGPAHVGGARDRVAEGVRRAFGPSREPEIAGRLTGG